MIECEPVAREVLTITAEPPVTVEAPREVPESKKVTVPVGLPLVVEIFAVSTRVCPKLDGLVFELTITVVFAGFIVSIRALDVLEAKLLSPKYLTVMECEPPVRFDTLICAVFDDIVPLPSPIVPSKKMTEPVALPPP